MKQNNCNFLQDFTKNTLQVELDDSSDSLFDSTQVSIPLTQQELTISPVEGLVLHFL